MTTSKKEETNTITPRPVKKRITSGFKNKQDRETFGKIYLDWRKDIDKAGPVSASEIASAGSQNTLQEIWTCVERGKHDLGNVAFYVAIYMRPERLMPGFGRQQFAYFEACPTPTYLQSVWKYEPKYNDIKYLWSLPTKKRCFDMYQNKQFVPLEEYELLGYVIDFIEGKLDKKVQELNNEPCLDARSNEF